MPTRVALKQERNLFAENPRVPGPGSSSQGKPGPKTRLKSVVDGKRVNIPAPISDNGDGETEKDRSATCWILWFKDVGGKGRKIHLYITLRSEHERRGNPERRVPTLCSQENLLSHAEIACTGNRHRWVGRIYQGA
jgi:hypothetical protein